MATMDRYGRVWSGTENLCPECGQPLIEGSCDHEDRSNVIGAAVGLSLLGHKVAVLTGGNGDPRRSQLVTTGTLKELTPEELVVETRGIGERRIVRSAVDRVTGPYFDK